MQGVADIVISLPLCPLCRYRCDSYAKLLYNASERRYKMASKTVTGKTTADKLAWIVECNEAYYNGEPMVTDEEYDRLVAEYTELSGIEGNEPTTATAPPADKVRVTLPVYMGGTNKFKYNDDPRVLQRFAAGCEEFLITEKLDGTAAVVEIPAKKGVRAYTRGDYSTGFEITELLRAVIPRWKRWGSTVFIRGELIMPREVFQRKYAQDFTNSRSLVNGVVNAKNRDPNVVADIHFVAFEILTENRGVFSDQLDVLESHGIRTPNRHIITADSLTPEHLASVYAEHSSDYTLDGLVVYRNDVPEPLCTDRNPGFSIAYKPATETVQVTISAIEWTCTRYNKLKPVAVFPAVTLAGTSVTHATAHNGRYVTLHSLGPGAVIEITKSNEVIPYIVRVISPVDIPDVPHQPHEWDDGLVDYISTGTDPAVLVKQITHFLKSTGVKGISEKTVEKITETGVTTILEFLQVSEETLAELPGFKQRKIENFYKSLSVLRDGVHLADVMAGAPEFPHGLGKRKFHAIVAEIPDILDNPVDLEERLARVRGIATSAALVCGGLVEFIQFVSTAREVITVIIPLPTSVASGGEWSVVFSGFRDQDLETIINEHGGCVTANVTKKTSAVIVTNAEKSTVKTRRADELGIPVVLKDQYLSGLQV